MKKIILLVTVIFCLKLTNAQPGQLDPLFGINGIAKNVFGSKNDENSDGQQVLLKTDGSMFVITETKEQTLVAKRFSNGSPDSSYGVNGFSVSVPIWGAKAALQPDGKIVVAGSSYNGDHYAGNYEDIGIARFNTNGSLDKTFDGDGQLTSGFSDNDGASAIAIQTDGKILIAVNFNSPFEYNHLNLIRYNKDGSFDKTFNADQIVQSRFGYYEGKAASIAIQSDGKIILSATVASEEMAAFLLMRFNIDASLDPAFADNGIAKDNEAVSGNSIVIQSDGKIVVAGETLLRRYNINGTLDKTFSGDGKQTSAFPIVSAAIQSDGKIVAGGTFADDFALARYNTNGSLDNTFSGDGKQITDFSASDNANSIAIVSDGRIVAAGSTSSGSITNFAVARYTINGTLDNTLSGDGTLTDHLRQGNTVYKTTAVQGDGKIVAGGDRILVRYASTGNLDKTFSGNGLQTTDFSVNSIAIQSDGKIVAAGDRVLARYNTDGNLDLTFSGDGKQSVNFVINSIVIQSNGKIVAGGSSLARYKTDGSLDISFAGDGAIVTPFKCNDLAMQSDGKVVAVGYLDGNFAIARYTAGGYPDNSFSGDGLQTTDFGRGEDFDLGYSEEFHAQSVALQSDGKIIAAGYTLSPYRIIRSVFALARYNTDGSLDTGFSGDGMQQTGFGGKDRASSVAVQGDGKILAAGYSWNGSNKDFALARYNIDGNLDKSFGAGGIQITPIGGANDEIQNIAIANNKLYTVGYAQYPNNAGIAARYLLEANKAPVVRITSPANNAVFYAPASISISASATDADGKISSVKFYNGTTLLTTEYYYPYTYSWSNVPAGTYSLTAKATDNFGVVTASAVVKVTVMANKAPVVSITSPANNTIYTAPATINLSAKATDADGTISNVKFYNGTTLLITENYAPYTYTWSNVPEGTYSLTAKATDNHGLSATSAVVYVTVKASNSSIVSSKPFSINDQTDANGPLSMRLSPNPAKSTLQIYTKGLQLNKPSTISVISAAGVVMKTIRTNSSNQVVPLDVSSLASGVYTIKVISGDKILYKPFVKL